MPSKLALLLAAVLSMSALLFAAPSQAAGAGTVDIVGLKVGMTIDEATRAIKAYNPDLQIQPPVRKVLQYRVGNETRKTEPFVSYLFAVSGKKQKDEIYVYFSYPPAEPRVVAIRRLHNNFDPPITRGNYLKALVEKYGQPDAAEKEKHVDESRRTDSYQWHLGDGKAQCAPYFAGGREVEGKFGSLSIGHFEKREVLRRITTTPGSFQPIVPPVDPAGCAALLTYTLGQDPLFSATGTLLDVHAAAQSERVLSEWIDELVRKGEAQGKGSTARPKL